MSNQQVSIPELLLSLDSSELQEAEQVRAAVNHQLSSDRGGAVLSSLVDHYVDSCSCQVVQLLSSIREPHHKALLEKLNECVSRPGSRLAAVTLLGDLIRKQPPWVHHISRSPLLPSLLRCLKTDTDVVVLITGVLVLVALLPQIPQAGKQHIYDFFDVFGRLAAWSHKNPGHVPGVHRVHRVHLHAGVYSLFHRLYGMFPCNFMSYLRLHYSMKENLDTFQEVVKPMLEHVRVHPELVTGTQDYELDPSRWRCYEVHDIMIECSRVSLDPLEASCEDEPPPSAPPTHLNLTCSPGSSVLPLMPSGRQLSLHTSVTQVDDVTWSPSSQCGLSTPPPEPSAAGSAPPLSRTASISGAKCPSPASVPATPLTEENQDGVLSPGNSSSQVKLQASPIRPITEREGGDVISSISGDVLFTSTPGRDQPSPGSALRSVSLCFTPPQDGGSAPFCQSPAPLYEPLFELALPRAAAANAAAAALLTGRKTQEALERTEGEPGGGQGEDGGEDASVSPLQVLDQLIVHGHDAHQRLSRSGSLDWTLGGKHQSMKTKGPAQGEELQCLRSQLLLVHSQLQYERFKRQQHAVRNRRLLRRVINTTALEEHSVAMKGQLGVQDEEIRSLKSSLQEEQRRHTHLQQDTHTHTAQLHTHIQQLLLQRDEEQRDRQRTQSELQECRSRLWDLEAELQRANNKAYNAEHQLTQLSLKVCSSEQLQQQIFLLNQQLVLLRDTNRALSDRLEAGETRSCSEASMLQCTVGKELQRLRDSDVQQRQKLEAANHRAAELESQLALKEELILDQKKLLEATKAQSRAELSACESRCVALRRVAQTLQTESLHLYSLIHLDTHTDTHLDTHTLSRPQDVRPNGAHRPRPFSSSVGILNGGVATLSTSPLLLPSCSSSPLSLSPIESPLAVGSFLEQRARQLFRPTNHSQEEEPQEGEEEEGDEGDGEEEGEEEEAQPESPPLGQEAEEASLLTGSPPMDPVSRAPAPGPPAPGAPAPPSDLTLAVRQRRHELSIMDYDETVPEY